MVTLIRWNSVKVSKVMHRTNTWIFLTGILNLVQTLFTNLAQNACCVLFDLLFNSLVCKGHYHRLCSLISTHHFRLDNTYHIQI